MSHLGPQFRHTFGIPVGYDMLEEGASRAVKREREAQLVKRKRLAKAEGTRSSVPSTLLTTNSERRDDAAGSEEMWLCAAINVCAARTLQGPR